MRPLSLLFAVLVALCLSVAAGVPEAEGRPVVSAARLGVHPDKTRFVLELSEAVDFRVFALDQPYRVVVDFPEVAWAVDASDLRAAGLVQGYRHGLFELGTMRVVLDLTGPARVRDAFVIPPGQGADAARFVLDLEPVAAGSFAPEKDRVLGARAAAGTVTPASLTVPVPPIPPGLGRDPEEKPLVVIDAGHGGIDPGAVGVGGVHEKDVTLGVARRLKDELEATGRFRVLLTRDQDVFLRLRDRPAVARRTGARMFVSLHADSAENVSFRGASVYTLSDKASDREAAMLAAKENRADAVAGLDLAEETDEVASILIDLAQRDTRNQAARVANVLVEEMRAGGIGLLGKPLRSAGLAVLTAPDVPSVLVEMGYLSNPDDARGLASAEHQGRLARALARGIARYFDSLAEPGRT